MPTQHRRRSRLALVVALGLIAFAACFATATGTGNGLAVAPESTEADGESPTAPTSAAVPAPARERLPEFVATSEWKEILPGQGIPRGLHVRMNLETGKKEAKLMDPTDAADADESMRSVVVDPDSTVTVATDVDGEVSTVAKAAKAGARGVVAVDTEASAATGDNGDEAPPAKEPAWNHEKIYEVLQALPEPPVLDDGLDINEAYATLPKAEFRRQIVKLWKKRQQDLKDAIESMQDDSKHLGRLLEEFREAERAGSTDGMLHALEVIEWEVQDLDKTYVFNFIGGFEVIAGYLNATNLPVRARAAWVVGSAAKNYNDGQNWAIDAGAVPKLVESLALEAQSSNGGGGGDSDESASSRLREVFEVKKKALYAISSLVLFNERGQRLFLLHHGPKVLATVFDDGLHPASVQLKAALLIHDILLETAPEPMEGADASAERESSLQQLQSVFRSTEWCKRLSTFFLEHSSKLRQRQALEILGAMRNQLPACRETFQSAGVKSTVESVAASFAQDAELDGDEKREIEAFGTFKAMAFKPPKWAATPARVNRLARLDVLKGGETVESVALGARGCTVLGRRADVCDYEMAHPSISRQHAALVHDQRGRVTLLDLGSAQGSFLNNREIAPDTPVVLSDGDEIRFGASTRVYVFRNPAPSDDAASADEMERDESAVAAARKQREAEIAVMTAQMLAAPATVQEPVSSVRDEDDAEPPRDASAADNTNAEGDDNESDDDDGGGDDDESDEGGSAKDDVASRYNIPMSHEVSLESHVKAIACLAVDPPGGRVATGSMDYHAKLWDFAGMARHVRPFRDVEVDDGHPVVAVSYSPSGDRLLAATGSSQPKVLSREGVEELQFAKGDMYVMDMAHTNGHTHAVTGGAWHPTLRDQMITSSLDGTVRIWSLGGKLALRKLVNTAVLKFKSKRGRRGAVTTCRYNLDGTLVAGGTMDGQIQCVDPRKAYAGASLTIRDAHADGSGDLGISSVRFSPDSRLLASRSCADDTVKIWDLRKASAPVKVFTGVEAVFGTANVAFNASGTCVAAGTSVRRGQGLRGKVLFLDVHTPGLLAPIASVDMKEDESAVCVEWHHGINQVFAGSSSGAVRVLYNPALSSKGVLLTATKKLKVQRQDSGARIDGLGQVHNPHALPMYRDEDSRKRKFHKLRADPVKSKAPEKPLTGPGMGGKISGSTTFTQYFMSSHVKSSFREEDPREAILKYAKKAQEAPQFVAPVAGKIDARYGLAKETLEQEKIAHEEEEKRLLQR
ncbi:hypothetical protein PybrP1_003713 [[Pythium] brassicae (nom. inval.)]|nr:hypothetical protein PybrP1_003713 [[Pythium] brassicae (nom. inval.)]